jgi:transposase
VELRSYCAIDLHHKHTVFEAQASRGGVSLHRDRPTERQHLIETVKAVRGPKGVVIEEGPMADWAMRVIRPFVTEVVICDPRRNRLITQDGDKTDHLDPGKLIELYRLGALRRVHHPDRQSLVDLRAWVWAYHDQVELVVAAKNKIKAALRSAGVQYGQANVYDLSERSTWLKQLPRRWARDRLEMLYGNLDDLMSRRDQMHKRVRRLARGHPVAKRLLAVPGYREIRALTFMVIVDTPFRFATPQKLWRYGGLGLQRQQSGDPENDHKRPAIHYNRRLKNIANGAMEIALWASGPNPFQVIYERLISKGLRDPLARLTVARKLLSVPWGMWKSGMEYNPALVT